jgi:hypothetical protein
MNGGGPWEVALFLSVQHALRAEKLLKAADIPCKLIPVPRQLSSDCGVCLRFDPSLRSRIETTLTGRVEISAIHAL